MRLFKNKERGKVVKENQKRLINGRYLPYLLQKITIVSFTNFEVYIANDRAKRTLLEYLKDFSSMTGHDGIPRVDFNSEENGGEIIKIVITKGDPKQVFNMFAEYSLISKSTKDRILEVLNHQDTVTPIANEAQPLI